MKKLISALFLVLPMWLIAQPDPRLADYYFQNGELEKASAIYEKLYQPHREN